MERIKKKKVTSRALLILKRTEYSSSLYYIKNVSNIKKHYLFKVSVYLFYN